MRPVAMVIVVTLLVAGVGARAAESPERVLAWDYDVEVTDPASGTLDVTIRLAGVRGVVEGVTFQTSTHPYRVLDVKSDASRIEPDAAGDTVLVVGGDSESVTFTIDPTRDSPVAGERHAHLGPDWGLVKLEAIAPGFTYSYLEGVPFRWASRIRFHLPAGWAAETSLLRDGDAHVLPRGDVLPRGFVALGSFETETRAFAGKEFRYARLGNPLPSEADAWTYLERATPYYEQVYGPALGDRVLVASAPAPMLRGGLGAADSFFVHEESDLRTFAHEYAHVWQLFATSEEPGDAAVWLHEGDAEYHGLLSLVVTEQWSLDRANALLAEWRAEASREPFRSARLVDVTYGAIEDVGYHKGALVLHALDAALGAASYGAVGLPDLLRALNEAHDPRVREANGAAEARRLAEVTAGETLAVAERLVGAVQPADFAPFFENYVYGRSYPELEPIAARDELALASLDVTPSIARAGDTVRATVRVENRGLAEAFRRVPLLLDGAVLGERDVRLGVGEAEELAFDFPAPAPGDHQVRALYLEAALRVLAPARLRVASAQWMPATPVAGEMAELIVLVRNDGEAAGDAHVVVVVDGWRVAGERDVRVPGEVASAVAFPIVFTTPGRHDADARLGAAGEGLATSVSVAEPDADADGVPDARDAYPTNARLQNKSVANDVTNAVGAPAAALAAIAIAVGAHVRASQGRRAARPPTGERARRVHGGADRSETTSVDAAAARRRR